MWLHITHNIQQNIYGESPVVTHNIGQLCADLLQADGQADYYDEADSRFSQFCANA